MNKETKKQVGIDKFKEYDEQKEIRKSYFKGCGVCGRILGRCDLKSATSLHIKNDKIQIINLHQKNQILAEYDIRFCPFCGKQLVEKLDIYVN